jgi:flagellar hook-associated protein 1
MRSTFGGLGTALRALQAQQAGLDVTNHNMANVNTEGFTRQAAEFVASTPFTVPGTNRPQSAGQLGTGVEVSAIRRFRDAFVDSQVRTENAALGQSNVRRDTLSQIEQIFNEPSATGISASLTRFWNDWSNLGNNPESEAVRKGLVENAITLTDQLNHSYNQSLIQPARRRPEGCRFSDRAARARRQQLPSPDRRLEQPDCQDHRRWRLA